MTIKLENLNGINYNQDFWTSRVYAYEKKMQPKWNDMKEVTELALQALSMSQLFFVIVAVGCVIKFGAIMVIPAVGLLVATLALRFFQMLLREHKYEFTDPTIIVAHEKQIVEDLDKGGKFSEAIDALKATGSQLSPSHLFRYHLEKMDRTKITDEQIRDFHSVAPFLHYSYFYEIREEYIKRFGTPEEIAKLRYPERGKLFPLGMNMEGIG